MRTRSLDVSSAPGRQLVTLSAGWLVFQVGRQLFPPLLPTIIESFAISAAEAGVTLTVLWLTFSILHYPGGRLADRLSRKTVVVGGLVVAVAGFLLLAGSVTFDTLLLASAVIGAGGGLFFMGMRVLLSDAFADRRGEAFGVNMAAGHVGAILAAGFVAAGLAGDSWRLVFVPIAAGLVAVVVALHLDVREPYRVARVSLGLRPMVARVLGAPGIRWSMVAYSLFILSWQGVLGFLPTFLAVERGFSVAVASAGFAIPYAVGLVVTPVAGGLSDRLPSVYVIAGAPLVAALGIVGLVLGASAGVVLAWTAVFAVGLMAFPPAMQSHVMARFADASVGGEFGVFKTVYTGVGSLGPAYVGLVVASSSYLVAFGSLAASMLVACAIAFVQFRDGG